MQLFRLHGQKDDAIPSPQDGWERQHRLQSPPSHAGREKWSNCGKKRRGPIRVILDREAREDYKLSMSDKRYLLLLGNDSGLFIDGSTNWPFSCAISTMVAETD